MNYDFARIEEKWHKYWEEHDTFHTYVWDFSKPKYYVLDMFPYPSGVGRHAGHPEGYTATDIMSRMKRMQGYNVLHPMGYDSFGLPAEQYAVNTGHHPDGFTQENIKTFSKQLRELTVTVTAKGGGNGRLFGSITNAEIAEALEKKTGIKLDKRKLVLNETIKNVGTYTVTCKLGYEITAPLTVKIEEA